MKEHNETKAPLKLIGNIIYAIICIIAILLLLVVGTQRASNNKKSFAGYRLYNIVTGSMIPKYQVGDVLLVKEIDAKDIQIGDDISYLGAVDTFKDKIVTHRIKEKKIGNDGRYTFITRGIANDDDDPEINEDQIFGKVSHKFVILSFISRQIASRESKFIVFIIPVIVAVAVYFVKMKLASNEIMNFDEKDERRKDKFDDIDLDDIDNLSEEELEALLEEDEDIDDYDEELERLEQEEMAKLMEADSKTKSKRKK